MGTDRKGEAQAVELLEQLAYAVAGAGHRQGLTAAQWAALRFFGRANRFSRTVTSFAEYHATTKGTASQTVRRLVDRGLLRKSPSAVDDGRSHLLNLTAKGKKALAEDPLNDLLGSLRSLASDTRAQFVETLRLLLADMARVRGLRSFGTCLTCTYLDCDRRSAEGAAGCWCNLFEESLDTAELEQLCLNHAPAG